MLSCQSEVAFISINGLGEVLAHYNGYEAWKGGEETCVYVLAPGINNGAKTGPVYEMHKGGEHVHVVHTVCENLGLEGSMG